MTRIILVRHGHVDWIAPERFRGRAELSLSPLGEKQAQALGKRIAHSWRAEAIYTSPQSRAVQTGQAISLALGVPAQALDDLADIDYGQWQGLTHDEAGLRWPQQLHHWLKHPDLAVIPGGETLADVLVRALRVLHRALRGNQGETLVLVGHDSINRVLLLQALGLPLARYWRIKQEPCCINELTVSDGEFSIVRLNESCPVTAAGESINL